MRFLISYKIVFFKILNYLLFYNFNRLTGFIQREAKRVHPLISPNHSIIYIIKNGSVGFEQLEVSRLFKLSSRPVGEDYRSNSRIQNPEYRPPKNLIYQKSKFPNAFFPKTKFQIPFSCSNEKFTKKVQIAKNGVNYRQSSKKHGFSTTVATC